MTHLKSLLTDASAQVCISKKKELFVYSAVGGVRQWVLPSTITFVTLQDSNISSWGLLFLVCTLQRKVLLSCFVPFVLVAPTSSLHSWTLISLTITCCLPTSLFLQGREREHPIAIQPLIFWLIYWQRDIGKVSNWTLQTTKIWCQKVCGCIWARVIVENVSNILNSEEQNVFADVCLYFFSLTLQTQYLLLIRDQLL